MSNSAYRLIKNNTPGRYTFILTATKELPRRLMTSKRKTIGSVSYTHLDVYKRQELTAADGLERYLGAKFPGAKRFSLEGSDAFIPLMKEIIRHASKQG